MEQSNPALKRLEDEIYKALEGHSKAETTKVSEYLRCLDIILPVNFRSKYSAKSLAKAAVFMELKGLCSQSQLAKHLQRNPEDAKNLGFKELPDRRTIGYFLNARAARGPKEIIDFVISKTVEVADKFGIVFDTAVLKPKKSEVSERRKKDNLKGKTRDVCKLARRKIYPHITLDIRNNSIHKKKDYLDLLTFIGTISEAAENGARRFHKHERSPAGEMLLHHIKKLKSTATVEEMFFKAFDILWKLAKASKMFDDRKPVDVAIDATEWFYYGDKRTPMVVGKKPERGTHRCYKFITIDIVEEGRRFTLMALPVAETDYQHRLVERLLEYAKSKVRIRYVYMDRGFFNVKIMNLMKRIGLTFIMPATSTPSVASAVKSLPAPTIAEHEIKGDYGIARFNLAVMEVKDKHGETKKIAFATNMDFKEQEAGLAHRIAELYSRRWSIETGYRVKKKAFRSWTTSKKYVVRLFYFMYSVVLYDLWIIAGFILKREFGVTTDKYLVTATVFGETFSMLLEDG